MTALAPSPLSDENFIAGARTPARLGAVSPLVKCGAAAFPGSAVEAGFWARARRKSLLRAFLMVSQRRNA